MSIKAFVGKKGEKYAYLFIDEVTGIFYFQKRVGERVVKRSLETTDLILAKRKLLDFLKNVDSLLVEKKPKTNKLVRDFYQELYEDKKINGIKEVTLSRFDIIWRNYLEEFFGNVAPSRITQEKINEYILWHKKEKPGVQLYNSFKYLRNIINYMVEKGAIEYAKKPKIELPKDEQKIVDKKKGRVINDAEFYAIIDNGTERLRLIASMAYYCGMRKMEICSLRKDQIKVIKNDYFIQLSEDDTKTGLPRIVPIPDKLKDLFLKFYDEAYGSFIFSMKTKDNHISGQLLDKEWFGAKKLAKVKGRLRFHDLRHSCATHTARKNINPMVACSLLGMSFKTYQRIYLNLTESDIKLAVETMSLGGHE